MLKKEPSAEEERILELVRGAWSPATNEKYERMLRVYTDWCAKQGVCPLPASEDTSVRFTAYLIETKRFSPTRLNQALCAIRRAHDIAGVESHIRRSERVKHMVRGHRREHGTGPVKQARPLALEELRLMVRALTPDRPVDIRDRALLLVGFAGALRASELLGLRVEDLTWEADGVVARVHGAKGDRAFEGQTVTLPRIPDTEVCPVTALRALIRVRRHAERSAESKGPLFNPYHYRAGLQLERTFSRRAWAGRLVELAEMAGVSTEGLSTHSLRSGMATAALERGCDISAVAKMGRWSNYAMVMRYDRRGRWKNNAAAHVLVASGQAR